MDIIYWIEAINIFIFSTLVLQVTRDRDLSLGHNILSWVKWLTTSYLEQTQYSLWKAGNRAIIKSLREMVWVMYGKTIRFSHYPFRTYGAMLVGNVLTNLQKYLFLHFFYLPSILIHTEIKLHLYKVFHYVQEWTANFRDFV